VTGLFAFSIAAALSLGHATPAQSQARPAQPAPGASAQGQTTPAQPPVAPAQTAREVTLNSFKSSSLWPIWAAQHQEYFQRQGVAIKNVYTVDSATQMIGLIRGEFDIVLTALDDVIAYSEGEGAPQAPRNADLIAFLGGNNGALSLFARPEIQGVRELKGRALAVDATGTGISFVVREILARQGFPANSYRLIAFGNASARWEALRENKASATLLTPPISQIALAHGYNFIANVADVLGGYQGIVAAARSDWAAANADALISFIRGYRSGLDWLKARANKAAALDVLRREMPEVAATAEENYALLIANPKGFDPGGRIDPAGARKVFDLRRRFGPQGKPAADVGRYMDDSYFRRAIAP
jgi:ABC-type nitrate/sulfonate/bicarbonate transport system substrate-binding protein